MHQAKKLKVDTEQISLPPFRVADDIVVRLIETTIEAEAALASWLSDADRDGNGAPPRVIGLDTEWGARDLCNGEAASSLPAVALVQLCAARECLLIRTHLLSSDSVALPSLAALLRDHRFVKVGSAICTDLAMLAAQGLGEAAPQHYFDLQVLASCQTNELHFCCC